MDENAVLETEDTTNPLATAGAGRSAVLASRLKDEDQDRRDQDQRSTANHGDVNDSGDSESGDNDRDESRDGDRHPRRSAEQPIVELQNQLEDLIQQLHHVI